MNVRELMTQNPKCLPTSATCVQAAQTMRDHKTGDVLVQDASGKLCGIVTDRDLTVRCMAEGKDASNTRLGDICTEKLFTLEPNQSIDKAIELMGDKKVRRLPVVENDEVIGILSLGDLAEKRDPKSLLGQISRAPASA